MGVYTGTRVDRTSEVFSVDPANERCVARLENLLVNSEAFDSWPTLTNTTISSNVTATTAPNGTTTADKLIETTANGGHAIQQGSISKEANQTLTLTVYAKAAERSWLGLVINSGDGFGVGRYGAEFNLATGIAQQHDPAQGTYSNGSCSITSIGNGWHRCRITCTSSTEATVGVRIFVFQSEAQWTSASGYTGDGISGLYLWGAQLERNSIESSYRATTTTAITRKSTITDLSSSAVAGTKKGKVGYNPYTRTGTFEFNNTTSDFIEFSRNATIDITDNLTIETWIYPRSFVNIGGILTYGTGSGEQFALWTSNTNKVAFSTNWPNTLYQGYSDTLTTNTWYHIVVTFSSGAWRIYINGRLSTSGTFAISTLPQVANAYVTLGNNHPGGQEYFNGFMGATKIYNRVLGDVEIIDNYNASRTRYGYRTQTFELPSNAIGLSQSNPAASAAAIKAAYPYAPDGVYWINLPTSGATQIYCLMDEAYDGGGWMLMMKATRGTTFNYSANYWTTDNTLNATSINLNDGDAKYDVMNKFQAKDMMAIWPDILQNGGSITGKRGWTWLQNNFNAGTRITPISFWNTVDRYFLGDAKLFSGWASGVFSSQTDVRFYGFNYRNDQVLANGTRTRWGFGWNENGGGLYPSGNMGSDDVAGGIGLNGVQQNTAAKYSAGDLIGCCQDTTGINRSARVELYVR